jgi:hypothetical protein
MASAVFSGHRSGATVCAPAASQLIFRKWASALRADHAR